MRAVTGQVPYKQLAQGFTTVKSMMFGKNPKLALQERAQIKFCSNDLILLFLL